MNMSGSSLRFPYLIALLAALSGCHKVAAPSDTSTSSGDGDAG